MATAARRLDDDDRALGRTRVLLTGTLMTSDGAVQVRIRDISAAGAQVLAERPIKPERDALLRRGDLFAAARVVWSDDRRAGLSFYRPIGLDEMPGAANAPE